MSSALFAAGVISVAYFITTRLMNSFNKTEAAIFPAMLP